MNASISVVCYRSKTLKNGENPLMLQTTRNGRRKYKSTGLSINPIFWDFAKNRVKPNCPNGEFIQKILLDCILEYQKQILEFNANRKEYTLTSLLESTKSQIKDRTVGEFYLELIAGFTEGKKVGNRLIYKGSYNSVKAFSKGKMNFLFADIDVSWLQRYEKWLRAKGNKDTTISLLLRTLRSAYNKAIEAKCASKSNYPFDDYKISKLKVKTTKRAITKDDIQNIATVDLAAEPEMVRFARDIFLFTYFSGGINFTDLSNLKGINIQDNRIEYIRQKTGKKISLPLGQEANRIISHYKSVCLSSGYLFPILDRKIHKTAIQKQNRIHKVLVKVNRSLKRVGTLAGVRIPLTTYVARHSFATVLKKSGVSISLISEALGHSELSTTQIYLDSFENEQIGAALRNLSF